MANSKSAATPLIIKTLIFIQLNDVKLMCIKILFLILGVLVINVTWRGKTYVGTLLDSTRHVNQWAPPRDSDSPVSDSRAPKGRGKRGRGAHD